MIFSILYVTTRPDLLFLESSAKALYRRGMAHGILKNEDQQLEDLISASKLVPEDALISGELAKISQRKKEHREREKKAYAKLFS